MFLIGLMIYLYMFMYSIRVSKREITNVDFMILKPIEFYNRFMKKQLKVHKYLAGNSRCEEPLIVDIIDKCNRAVTRSMVVKR